MRMRSVSFELVHLLCSATALSDCEQCSSERDDGGGIIVLVQLSSAAVECVFSILQNSFLKNRTPHSKITFLRLSCYINFFLKHDRQTYSMRRISVIKEQAGKKLNLSRPKIQLSI